MCVLIFFTDFDWNIFHSKKKWAKCDKNIYRSSCKVPFILDWFYWNLNFLDRFSKNPLRSNSKKICPMGAELFHADRGTDGQVWRSLFRCFRNFANAPKIWLKSVRDIWNMERREVGVEELRLVPSSRNCEWNGKDEIIGKINGHFQS